ncbi:uncharacterized protein LOC105433339 [Pogonomyrmex barbatus]|uniref:Uncharacterized protein LOC105433339 n=1 Tax=Pogonomyrmex barbatus TaxID=144034 RepID=A0A6I9X2V4_9HYME|nr:uncharacterized protein LOC105433339 [Pogonomyrmex barbatus]
MLGDKIFIKSVAHRFSKISHFGEVNRVCQFCKKTFCCMKCRDRHVDKAHPDVNVNCSLCASKILPIRQYESAKLNLKDEKLLCHIVDKHLPLHCRLCGDLFESKEDFKSIAACKWFERWHCLTSPNNHELLQKKPKCSSGSDYNGSRFSTPPEIYRKTSTPMFVGQKVDFETLCVPDFSLKTPPIIQSDVISKSNNQDTQFFSFLQNISNGETTPFRTAKNEQFSRTNSGRKLNIMKEQKETTDNETEKITANANKVSSSDMNLTMPTENILQDSPKLDDIRENVMKKVRFSDHYETAVGIEDLIESYMRDILNTSTEEEGDAHDVTNAQKANTTKNMKDTKDTVDTKITEDTKVVKDTKCSLIRKKFLNDSPIEVIQNNAKSIEKEKCNPKESNISLSTVNQGDSNTVVMVMLMQSNSKGLTSDLMPLISSGLKKMQEQLSVNGQSSSNTIEPSSTPNLCRKSITKMKMSVSSVKSYSPSSAMMTNSRQIASSIQNRENTNSGGFLSIIAHAMKHALRNFSVSSFRIPTMSIKTAKEIRQQETIEEFSQESFSDVNNSQVRPGKRAREVTEASSKEELIALDIRSPLAKRQRGWYNMIRGRQPISRMRNSRVTTSPRGISAETQVFSQGSLTVGDTVLPLPARAHQLT